ncbi:hypothetical protein [Desulfonatronum thioautotrophicum]|uniref:hypothetical protein n=1 Tax=Desulfonatronum thioautotrophicum TaxID=617001 RepID=UPI0005EADE13|nr:hypothetical protein [Desulfonatronum thioautotrophicum]
MRMEDFSALIAPDALFLALGAALLLLPGLVAMGAMCVALLTAASLRKSSRVFADKLAKQITEFGVLVLGAWLLIVSARWGLWIGEIWPVSEIQQAFYHLFFDIPGQTALVATLLSLLFVRTWRRKKRSSTGHFVLGGAACLAWMTALMLFIQGGLFLVQAETPPARMDISSTMMFLSVPTVWLVWAQALFLGMALAGGLGLLYLVIRRSREDYGRDYYGWAARACALRALSSGIVQVFWAGALYLSLSINQAWADLAIQEVSQWIRAALAALPGSPAFPAMLAYLAISLTAWLSLLPLVRSQNPMRLKGLMLVHVLFMFIAVVLLIMVVSELF